MVYKRMDQVEFSNSKLSKSIDLASSAIDSTILKVTDEFFAPAYRMINPDPAISRPNEFDDNGSWMDGWESKRHNENYDWCIIKLGLQGSILGFDIDTSHFTGNQAPAASVEGAYSESNSENDLVWTEILPKVDLPPNTHNYFALEKQSKVFTHLRLNIYPDGGVARFRAYGEIQPRLPKDKNTLIDLAFVGNGGKVVQTSNEHYGSADVLILPGRGRNMGDGWQTARSRIPNHSDFVVIQLGTPGHILQAQVDTHFFKGNYPRHVKLEATFTSDSVPSKDAQWVTLVEPTSTGPNNIFYFNTINSDKVFTHAKITIIPDGGLMRLRLYGVVEGGDLSIRQATYNHVITAEPLTSEGYAPYGDVIHPGSSRDVSGANYGTAEKYHRVAQVNNLFPNGNGKPNFCIFHCRPTHSLPFKVNLLERHPYSTQAFIPMTDGKTRGYLVVVALNGPDDKPDMKTLKAFLASSTQGINYHQGVWHHPMVALDHPTDFACFVHESGVPQDDCNEVNVPQTIVLLPGFHEINSKL